MRAVVVIDSWPIAFWSTADQPRGPRETAERATQVVRSHAGQAELHHSRTPTRAIAPVPVREVAAARCREHQVVELLAPTREMSTGRSKAGIATWRAQARLFGALAERLGEHGNVVLAWGTSGSAGRSWPLCACRTWTAPGTVCGSWSAPRRSVGGRMDVSATVSDVGGRRVYSGTVTCRRIGFG